MASKDDLVDWLVDALKALGGKGTIVQLCKYVWENHKTDLRASGNLFYTWQYDIRWAATKLRKNKIMKAATAFSKGVWELI